MLQFRFFSATLVVPPALITLLARYRFRLFVLAVIALLVYKKDIDIRFGSETTEQAPAETVLSVAPAVGSVVPTNFWSRISEAAETPVSESRRRQLDYLDRHAGLAVREMHRSGIPASITLAQALLESNVGRSTLATRNHNHFGIKCFSRTCSKGHCSNFDDDSHKDFFRIYADTEASFRAHSTFLERGKRYRSLFDLDAKDYKGWARGLRKAGYATDKRYAEKLIRLIEELELHRYDSL